VGGPADDERRALAAAGVEFTQDWQVALKRSRQETVDGVEERDGSRGLYASQVAPEAGDLGAAAERLHEAIQASADRTIDAADASASAGTRTIVIVALLALLAAAALAAFVTRSVIRPVKALGARLRSLDEHCLAGLEKGLQMVRDGNLTYELTPVTTPVDVDSTDELGQLSLTFNAMLGKTQVSIDAYNDMRDQLGALIGEVAGNATNVASASQQMASTSDEAGRAVGESARRSRSSPLARSESAGSWTRSPASPSRRTCSRSTRRSRPPAPASRAAASPSWPRRSASWPRSPRTRPGRSPA
jgi:methyl-accepting chemotaxis protein